ncbi:hypothetical protein V3C99_015773 [Haemonchus contortus]
MNDWVWWITSITNTTTNTIGVTANVFFLICVIFKKTPQQLATYSVIFFDTALCDLFACSTALLVRQRLYLAVWVFTSFSMDLVHCLALRHATLCMVSCYICTLMRYGEFCFHSLTVIISLDVLRRPRQHRSFSYFHLFAVIHSARCVFRLLPE